jgi:hypothetical protein
MKENWFKILLLIIIFIYVIGFLYEQYRLTKVHNLDVVNSIRLCANLSGDAVKSCSEAVKHQFIPSKN